MKQKTLSYLKVIITWLQAKYDNLSQNNDASLNAYNSLAPINSADKDNHYYNALSWALKNRKVENIRNIALTGPYGSGKSSILKTFQKKYTDKDLHYLEISLATFKEEINSENKPEEKEILRLIELSILQQIFYHVEDEKIPDSRFKKIKNYSSLKLYLTATGLSFFLFAILNYYYPYIIQKAFKDFPFSSLLNTCIHYTSYSIIVIGVFAFLLKSIRIISSITINKLKISNAEFDVGGNASKSILNNNLDEILYFFEVTPYNVVIIEDLDRFQQTEIFTKLREINLLLNSSEKTKQKDIVFIYAVRDEMFKDNDRTKFFDFIIPVIPVINSSNSGQMILEKKAKYNYDLSENLIDSISLFIDDMRLLHNIMNEFHLYKQTLDENLIQDKLLAILVYKNIFPFDFSELSNNKGVLFSSLDSKSKFVSVEIGKIEKEITEAKSEIRNLENIKLTDLEELRKIYILQTLKDLERFKSFVINRAEISIESLASEDTFEYMINNDLYYHMWHLQGYSLNFSIQKIPTPFKDVEKKVSSKTYLERKNEIEDWGSNKIEQLKIRIQELENKKNSVKSLKIQDVLKLNHEPIFEGIKENELIKVLLRNGYIAEDYLDYISIFYEGSITRSDNQFFLWINSQKKTGFDYKLNKVDKLIQKISPLDFTTEYVLNYDLLDHILVNQNYKDYKDSIFKKLGDQTEVSIKFIDGFIEQSIHTKEFFKSLCHVWSNIWGFIDNVSNYTKDKKAQYLKYIFEYGEISDIKTICDNSSLRQTILNDELFLNIIVDKEKLKEIIKSLALKFSSIDFSNSPKELLEFIYLNGYYQLNSEIIKSIIKFKGEFNQIAFDNSNYSCIKNSKCVLLINNVDNNLNEYLNKVYLQIDTNINEEENYLMLLINNKKIDSENVKQIIKQVDTKVSHLEKVENLEIQKYLISENKITPSWNNLFVDYTNSDNHITDSIISFVNNIDNAEELSKVKIPVKVNEKNYYGDFWKKIMSTEEFEDEVYDLITKSNSWWYSDLPIADLAHDKVKSLIEKNVLRPVVENFSAIKENYDGLLILFLEKHKKLFLEKLADYPIDSNDLGLLLKSTAFTNSEKNIILESVSEEIILSNRENLRLICEIALSDNSFRVNDTIVKDVVSSSSVLTTNRVKFFNVKHNQIETETLTAFLNGLGEPYSDISINGKRPSLDFNQANLKFTEILKNRNYISSFDSSKGKIRISTFRPK